MAEDTDRPSDRYVTPRELADLERRISRQAEFYSLQVEERVMKLMQDIQNRNDASLWRGSREINISRLCLTELDRLAVRIKADPLVIVAAAIPESLPPGDISPLMEPTIPDVTIWTAMPTIVTIPGPRCTSREL